MPERVFTIPGMGVRLPGIGVRLAPERVFTFRRNRCSGWVGKRIFVHVLCCLSLVRFVPSWVMGTIGAIVSLWPIWYLITLRRVVMRIRKQEGEQHLLTLLED